MEHISENLINLIHQLIRLGQQLGIPVFIAVSLVGLLLMLTAGKNPIRKKLGLLLMIFFVLAAFAIAYTPSISNTITAGKSPTKAEYGSIKEAVDATQPVGATLFKALFYAAIPITGIMFYVGLIIRFVAGKIPARKRMGIGLMMFSPTAMIAIIVIPKLLKYM